MSGRTVRVALAVLGMVVALTPPASALAAPAAAAAPGDVRAIAEGLTIAVSWSADDDPAVTGYRVTTSPDGPAVDVPSGADRAVLAGVRPNVAYTAQVAALVDGQPEPGVSAPEPVTVTAPGGSLAAVTPARLLDTRSGLGAPAGATRLVDLQVAGRGGVPASGVGSVALNVTVTAPAGAGFVTAYPSGTQRPTASSLNFVRGQTVANLVVVPVGANGRVALFASASTHLVADVAGWFSTASTASPSSGLFHGLSPSRLVDTRTGLGGATPGAGGSVDVQVTGLGDVPTTGVSAVVLNVTVAGGSAAGYVTAYPTGQPRPTASTVNFVANQIVANRVIVPVGADGRVTLFNSAGRTPLVVDVTGWFTDGSDGTAGGAYLAGVAPTRIVDTRIGVGAAKAPVAGGASLAVTAAGRAGLPPATAAAPPTGLVANVTAVAPTAAGYLTAYPSLTSRPTASDLNFTPGATVPNLALTALGVDGALLVYNNAGATHVLVDVVGYFVGDTVTPSTTHAARAGDVAEVADREVVLTPTADAPEVGDVLVAGASATTPDGLLVRVTGRDVEPDGSQRLTTEPATLQEAMGDGHFRVSAPLTADDVAASPLTAGALRSRLVAGAAAGPVTQPISRRVSCSSGGELSVSGSVSVTQSINLSVDWGWFSVRSISFTGTLTEDAALTATARAASGCALGPVPLLPAPIRFAPITFTVGPVPVVITPQLQFYLSASGTVAADVTTAATQRASGTLGLSWSDGRLSPIAHTSSSFGYSPPALSGNATVTAKVGPRIELFLYGIAGPYLNADASLRLNATLGAEPWWTLTGALDAGAGIALPMLGFDRSNPSILHFERVIAHAPWPQHLYAMECVSSDCYTTLRLVQTNDTGGAKRVIGGTFTGGGSGIAVNPAGTELVYRRAGSRGLTLYVRNIATGQDRQLTFQDPSCTNVDTFDSAPAWSPDGKWISFSRSSSFGWFTCPTDGLYVIPAGGGTPSRVSTNRSDGRPSWNPATTRWAITTGTTTPTLYTSNTNGSGKQTIYSGRSGDGFSPAAWSPNGNSIAFGTFGGSIIGVSTSGARQWTLTPAGYCTGYAPVWSRDSESLFYMACQSLNHTGTVYRIAAAGGAQPQAISFGNVVVGLAVGR